MNRPAAPRRWRTPIGRNHQRQHQERRDAAHVAAGDYRRARGIHGCDDEKNAAAGRRTAGRAARRRGASPRSTCRQQVRDSVFDRMRATFKRKRPSCAPRASRPRSGLAPKRTRADRILANAARQAAQIRGQGDASASEIYAKSYSRNAEFYSFYRSMQSYREAVGTRAMCS